MNNVEALKFAMTLYNAGEHVPADVMKDAGLHSLPMSIDQLIAALKAERNRVDILIRIAERQKNGLPVDPTMVTDAGGFIIDPGTQ